MANPTTPPDEAKWQRSCEVGEQVVRDGLFKKGARRLERGAESWDVIALGFGAHKASVEYLVAMVNPGSEDVIEAHLIAAIRGVCRGAQNPINEDGTPYMGDTK